MTNSSNSAATASGRSATWTRSCTTPEASRRRSRTRSACTRRTPASSGNTTTGSPRTPRCADHAGSSSLRSLRRQLRVRVLLVPVPGRDDRDRGEADGHRSHVGRPPWTEAEYGRLVSPGLSALNHQHFFCVRLDMSVDGFANDVHEVHTELAPAGPANPHGNAFKAVATKLKTEREAQQMIDPLNARFWRISNPTSRNGLGEPVAYKLLPGTNVRPFAASGSSVLERAGFMEKHPG